MRCQLVIFDCDGTLVDSERIANEVFAELITDEGLPTTFDECVRRYMGRSASSCVAEIEQRLGRPLRTDLLGLREKRITERFAADLEPIPGMEESLAALVNRGIPRCVASSSTRAEIAFKLDRTELTGYFGDDLFSAEAVRNPKPAPDLFAYAAATMGARPNQCVVIEDSRAGVAAARAAGMFTIGFADLTSPDALSAAGAEVVIADATEIPEVLHLMS
jgi:HAD superfamily hydrolase (TIGR01509 family)